MKVSFSSEIDMRTVVINDDDVRSLTSLLSAYEMLIHLSNKRRHENGQPLLDEEDEEEY